MKSHVHPAVVFWFLLGVSIMLSGSLPVCAKETHPIVIGQNFDAAPFGETEVAADGTSYEVRWTEARKIRQLVVEFAADAPMPSPEAVQVQYWHNHWHGTPDPVLGEVTPIAFGWTAMDDWSQGGWKDADVVSTVEGRRVVFTFHPTDRKEFKDLDAPAVAYRKTLKIRILSSSPLPRIKRFQATTDAICRPRDRADQLGRAGG